MEILRLIEELGALGEAGEKWYTHVIPGLISKTVVDAETYFTLLGELKRALPEEMTTATQVARDREKIVREAQEERAKILEAAREQAQLLISNDELVRQAQDRSGEIINQARIEAEAIKAEAETWARGIVERLENYMGRVSATIDKTKKALVSQPTGAARPSESRVSLDGDD
jgi:vacuolar-type H+-ATPase subunit H